MKLFFINILLFFLFQNQHVTYAANGKPDNKRDVITAANSGLVKYLEKIPAGKETLYGFNNRDEFAIAKTGKPYEVFTLSKEFFSDNKLSNKKKYLISTGEWRVPITVNGENRSMLTVSKMKGSWKVVGIGASGLSKELQKYEAKYSSPKEDGKILRIYQLDSDFFMARLNLYYGELRVIPLFTANTLFGEQGEKEISSYSINDALAVFKNKIDNK